MLARLIRVVSLHPADDILDPGFAEVALGRGLARGQPQGTNISWVRLRMLKTSHSP